MSQSGSIITASSLGAVMGLTGNSGGFVGPDGLGNINVIGSGVIAVAGNPGTNTLTISGSGTLATSYVTDAGSAVPALNVLNVLGGDNLNTTGSGSTLKVYLNETIHWPATNAGGTTGVIYLGGSGGAGGSRFIHNYGPATSSNTFVGLNAGNFTNTCGTNTALGYEALASISTGFASVEGGNTAIGKSALNSCTSGYYNSVLGRNALGGVSSGYGNIAAGLNIGWFLATGSRNILIGDNLYNHGDAANNRGADAYTGAESDNIIIGNYGVLGENNTIRIGTTGGGIWNQNRCFIAGVTGVTPAAVASITLTDTAGQLGTITQTNGQLLIGSTGANPVAAELTAGATSAITITPGAGSISIGTIAQTDGQLLIGRTGLTPLAATLTAGSGITITPGAGSIQVGSVGFTWAVTTIDAPMVINNGYIANKAGLLTMTLPATGAIGDILEITGINTAVGWRIAQNANQQIFFGATNTTLGAGGYLESTAIRDSVRLVCVVAGASTVYNVIYSIGNITVN